MTRKDLNLSFDQSLVQHSTTQTPPLRNVIQLPGGPKSKKPVKKPPSRRHPGIQTVTMAAIAFINIAALLLAAYWLSSLQPAVPRPAAGIAERSEFVLLEINEKITSMHGQLDTLQLTVLKQEQLLAQLVIGDAEDTQETIDTNKNTENPVLTKESPKPADNWYINLGTFISEEEAVGVKRQLRSIGLEAQIRHEVQGGTTAFEVHLPGFEDRDSAELAARKIMEQTRLNGLWVWKSDQATTIEGN